MVSAGRIAYTLVLPPTKGCCRSGSAGFARRQDLPTPHTRPRMWRSFDSAEETIALMSGKESLNMRLVKSVNRIVTAVVTGVLCIAMLAPAVQAAQWGDVTLQFIYDGPAPNAVPIQATKDPEFCGKHKLVDESLLVNKANGGVANVIVFIYVGRGKKQPAVHPSYAKVANANIKIDNAKCRFEPHVIALRTTQTLEVGNADPVGHNSNFTTFLNPGQNVLIPGGRSLKLNFPAEERLPTKVSCNIHPWMTAWMVVKQHPYVGVSDKDGKVVLKNVPAGKLTFQAWQEKAGYVREVKQGGKAAKWSKGRFDHTVKRGQNDLGEIKLPPSLFE